MLNLTIQKAIIPAGAISAFIAVAAGAFAAHGLKELLSAEYASTFKTAADYQMMHSLGLLSIGILNKQSTNPITHRRNSTAAAFMLLGIILFSGSLYLLTLTSTTWLGMITPLGGFCFLIAWLIVAFNYMSKKNKL